MDKKKVKEGLELIRGWEDFITGEKKFKVSYVDGARCISIVES